MNFVVADFDVVSLLTHQNQIGKFKGVDAQVIYKLGIWGNVTGIYGKLVYEKILDLFKHKSKPPKSILKCSLQ